MMTDAPRTSDLDSMSLKLSQDLNLKHLYYFHVVASMGTISRAARQLGLSAATISEQVKQLEHDLDQHLMERHSAGIRLTDAGQRVFEHTSQMFGVLHRMLQDIAPERYVRKWMLVVGMCPTVSRTLAVKRLLPLLELEGVSLRIRQGNYSDLMNALSAGRLDIVISENPASPKEQTSVESRAIQESPLVMVASPEIAQRISRYPAGLADQKMVHFSPQSRYRAEVDGFLQEHQVAPDVAAEADDVIFMMSAAETGPYVAPVPEVVAKEAIDEGRLVRLGPVNGTISAVYAHFRTTRTPEVVRQAIEMLARH